MKITSVWPYFFILGSLFFAAHSISQWIDGKNRRSRSLSTGRAFVAPLESLRGILALSVFFHHSVITYFYFKTGRWETPPSPFYNLLGSASVILFFFLTGYLFWNKLLINKKREGILEFYIGRCRRILPAYYFTVSLILVVVLFKSGFALHNSPKEVSHQILDWFLVGLPFGVFPDVNGFRNTLLVNAAVAWTLRLEFLFYFFLPFFSWFSKKHRTWGLLLLPFLVLPTMELFAIRSPTLFPQYQLLFKDFFQYMELGWGFGILAAYLKKVSSSKSLAWLRGRAGAIVSLCALAVHFQFFPFPKSIVQSLLLFPLFLSVVLGNDLFGLLSWQAARFLGRISYSIYLSHGLVLFATSHILNRIYGFSNLTAPQFWIWVGMSGFLVLILSTGIFYLVERPAMSRTK